MTSEKLVYMLFLLGLSFNSCAQQDSIIGVWDVKNDYYGAIYEIVEHDHTFFGKVHYYHDGTTTYHGDDKKEDYFLTAVEAKDKHNIKGKMYMPDGSYYEVLFNLKDVNTLEATMTVEGQPYTETWTRNTTYNLNND